MRQVLKRAFVYVRAVDLIRGTNLRSCITDNDGLTAANVKSFVGLIRADDENARPGLPSREPIPCYANKWLACFVLRLIRGLVSLGGDGAFQ